ncbi:MAG: methionine synthase [Gordonibacter sp.]
MPDISLRFHKDMLVLSAPLTAVLARQGIDTARDLEYLNLVEPEAVRDALRLESLAGAQCLVANTEGMAPARLAHQGMEDNLDALAHSALATARGLRPQHLLVEIGPCGLPLDGSSASSLNENRDQYARAARAFAGEEFDAFLLSGFAGASDLKCALMGVGQVSDRPVFASVEVGADGFLLDGRTSLEEAVALMGEFGASVAGFATGAAPRQAAALAGRACAAGYLPVLAQLRVAAHAPKQGEATPENPYYCPDTMVQAAALLRAAGVQFLRATGEATPAYTGALAATTEGFDVARAVEEA